MKRNRTRIVLGLAGLSVAIMGGLAGISCGSDDDSSPVTTGSEPTGTAKREITPTLTVTPTNAPPKLGEAQVGSISITGASVRETANDVTSMYMTIKTNGDGDRLVSAKTPISPMVQLHETVMASGAMKMQEVAGGIVVPPAGEVVLKPGGLHVMVMNLTAPLKVEQTVTFELTFEKAGKVALTVPVKTIGETVGMGGAGNAMGTVAPIPPRAR